MKQKIIKQVFFTLIIGLLVGLSACVPGLPGSNSAGAGSGGSNSPFSQLGFGQIGAGILGSAGVPHADAIFNVGEKLAKATQKLSPEQEYFLGRGVSAMVFSKYPPLKNTALNSYVNRVGNALAIYSDRPETYSGYHFVVVDTDQVNAMSAPGGFVYISKGFLKIIPSEDALAAVLAHEIGHINLDHGIDAISQSNLTDALTTVGKEAASSYGGYETQALVSTFGGSIKDVFDTLIENGYSRSQEYAADEYAAKLLPKAGYSASALTGMLALLKDFDGDKSGGWYSTHPSAERRISQFDEDKTIVAANDAGYKKRTARFKQATKALT